MLRVLAATISNPIVCLNMATSKDNAIEIHSLSKPEKSLSRTGGSVGLASGSYAGGRDFNSDRTNTRGLKITEEKVLPL